MAKTANKAKFTDEFMKTFEASAKMYGSTVSKVKSILNKDVKCEYGICNKYYKFRYITSEDVIDFISDIFDAIENNLLAVNVADVDIFSVKYVSEILGKHNCPPIEDNDTPGLDYMFNDQKDLNIKNMDLQSVVFACENEVMNTEVISGSDMKNRCKDIKDKIEILEKDNFIGTIRKLTTSFDDISKESTLYDDPLRMDLVRCAVEKFVTFSICLNMISMLNLVAYVNPVESWSSHDIRCDDYHVPIKNPANYRNNDTMHRYWTHDVKTSMLSITEEMCNFNIKNTVLTDLTENFKDTICMIDYVIRDTRSPFYMQIVNSIPRGYTHQMALNSCDPVISMLFGGIKGPGVDTILDMRPSTIAFPNGSSSIMSYKKQYDKLSSTDTGWLDRLTYGDSFDFGNKRLDTMIPRNQPTETGRCKLEIIIQSIWEMYKPKSQNKSEVAKSILSIAALMKSIIFSYVSHMNDTRTTISRENVVDILAELGEILTRQLLTIYRMYDETFHVKGDATPNDNEFVNPFMEYELEEFAFEEFMIEADTTVSIKSNKPKSFMAENVDSWVQKFIGWLTELLGKFGDKFNADHKKEVEWIKNNQKTIDAIQKELNTTGSQFVVGISDFYMYKIPAKAIIEGCNYDASVDEWIKKIDSSDESIDMVSIKKAVFPNPKDVSNNGWEEACNETDNGKLRAYLTNFFLFSRYTIKDEEKVSKENHLTGELFNDLVTNVRDTGPTLQRISREMSNKLKAALTKVQKAYDDAKKASDAKTPKTESAEFELDGDYIAEADVDLKAANAAMGQHHAVQHIQNAYDQKYKSTASGEQQKDTSIEVKTPESEKTEDGTKSNSKVERFKTLLTDLRTISNIYHVTCLNVIRSKFYKNSYKTFRAVVKGYLGWDGRDKNATGKAEEVPDETQKNAQPTDQQTTQPVNPQNAQNT